MMHLHGWSGFGVALMVGLVALFCGCASTSADDQGVQSDVASVVAATVEVVSEPASAGTELFELEFAASSEFVQSAAAFIDATPHRHEGFLGPAVGAIDVPEGFGRESVEMGESDGNITTSTMNLSSMGAGGDEELFRYTITDGSRMYQYDPNRDVMMSPFSRAGIPLEDGPLSLAADGWVVLDWAVLRPGVPIESTASASDLVQGFEVADVIVEGPTSQVRGVTTRTIYATIPFDALTADDGVDDADTDIFDGAFPESSVELTVHVDANGLIRRITTTLGGQVERSVEFFDIGADIVIELPDAIDITAMLVAEQEAFEATQAIDPTVLEAVESVSPEPAPTVSEPAGYSIIDLIEAQPELSTLLSFLEQEQTLLSLLESGDGSYTLFAPTNDAFAALGEAENAALRADSARVADLLGRHVVQGTVDSTGMARLASIETVTGDVLEFISTSAGNVEVEGHFVLINDVLAANGVMHILANVLTR